MLKEHKMTVFRIAGCVWLFVASRFVDFYIGFLLLVFAYLVSGIRVIKNSFTNLVRGRLFDENFLMLIATLGAFVTGQYIEAISVMIIYEVGEMLQDKAVDDSREVITKIIDIRPKFANLQKDSVVEKVLPKDVKIGDTVVVGVGEKIPLDGVIVKGETSVDLASLTGESLPQYAKVGDVVYAGGINTGGIVYVKVGKAYEESTIAKMFKFIEESNAKKSQLENFMTRFSKKYTPIVVSFALLFVLIAKNIAIIERIRRACMFLVIACPCALVLSVPVSFFCGVGECSKNGILVKGSVYLEMLSSVKNIIFDKTGTLTKGVFRVTKVSDIYNMGILEIAAYCESCSSHPIAMAIVGEYGKKINHDRLHDNKEIAGLGTTCKLDGKQVVVGSKRFMEKNNISVHHDLDDIGAIYVAYEDRYIGYIIVSDKIKDEAVETVDWLKRHGVDVAMITGDNKKTAVSVGNKLGITDVFYEIFPKDKASILEGYKKDKRASVAFVGDGINDVPSILAADIGIAMGAIGSDASIEASNIVIMDDHLSKIVQAINISKKTVRLVKENIVFILCVKFFVAILCGLGVAKMWEAIVADVGVSLVAILHSIRGFSFGGKR